MEDDSSAIKRREFARRTSLGIGGLVVTGLAGAAHHGRAGSRPAITTANRESPHSGRARTTIATGDDSNRRTRAAAVQEAIDRARDEGLDHVLVPPAFGPGVDGYDASAVDFDHDIPILREGQVLPYTVDVRAYGAAGDYDPGAGDGTDDTDAINAAADAVRSQTVAGGFLGRPEVAAGTCAATPTLYFPAGFYQCDETLWFGVDRTSGDDLDDGVKHVAADMGATIVSRNADGIALDLSGVLGFRCENLTLWGHESDTPRVGVFFARSGAGSPPPSAGEHWFHNVRVIGNFTLASVYNYASEINRWSQCELRNRQAGSESVFYATRDNSTNPVTSRHTGTQVDAGHSNFSPTFVNCRFHFDVAGTSTNGLFIAESSSGGPKFLGCYFDLLQRAASSPPVLRERSGGSVSGAEARTSGIVFRDCFFETDYESLLRIEGACRGVTVAGCTIKGPPDTADVVVAAGATLQDANIQSHRGHYRVERVTFQVDGSLQSRHNFGTVRIDDGDTSVTVEHGLNEGEMSLEHVWVTPTSRLGDAHSFWVDRLDDRSFRINVDSEPGRDGVTFAWSASLP